MVVVNCWQAFPYQLAKHENSETHIAYQIVLLLSQAPHNRPRYGLECIMVIRTIWLEIERFVWKFKPMKSISYMQFWALLSYKTNHMHFKVRLNNGGRTAVVEIILFSKQSLYHAFPVVPEAQNYRECMEKKREYLGIAKNRYRVQVNLVMNLNFYIWFMKAKVEKSRVMNNLFCFEFPYKPWIFSPCCPDYPSCTFNRKGVY